MKLLVKRKYLIFNSQNIADYNVHLTKAYVLHTTCLYTSVPYVLSSNVKAISFQNFNNFKATHMVQLLVLHLIT